MSLLATHSPESLTLAKVADSLGAGTMSLYTYFPSRDALLMAVSAYSLSQFEMPRERADWREFLLAWLWAVQKHHERYPFSFKTFSWTGEVTPALMKIHAPVNQILRDQGLRGKRLAFASAWFLASAMGLMSSKCVSSSSHVSFGHIDELPPAMQDVFLELHRNMPAVRPEKILEFGFRQLIAGVEQLLQEEPRPRARAGARLKKSADRPGARVLRALR